MKIEKISINKDEYPYIVTFVMKGNKKKKNLY